MAHSICLNFELLADESCDLSQREKKITVVKAKQIHKTTIIFTRNGQKLPLLWICSALETVVFFSAKSHDSSANSQELEQMEGT